MYTLPISASLKLDPVQATHYNKPRHHLKCQDLACVRGNISLDVRRAEQAVGVGNGSQVAFRGQVLAAAEVDVVDHGVALVRVVVGEDGLLGAVLEDRALDEDFGQISRVDGGVSQVGVVGAGEGGKEEVSMREDRGEFLLGRVR